LLSSSGTVNFLEPSVEILKRFKKKKKLPARDVGSHI
jgi:hypothetical protein